MSEQHDDQPSALERAVARRTQALRAGAIAAPGSYLAELYAEVTGLRGALRDSIAARSSGAVPPGRYELYADDDDVIGLTVAKTYPSGWAIVRTDPPLMDGFDEFAIGQFIADALSRSEASHG